MWVMVIEMKLSTLSSIDFQSEKVSSPGVLSRGNKLGLTYLKGPDSVLCLAYS